MTHPRAVPPDRVLVEYAPIHYVSFDLGATSPPPASIAFVQSQGANSSSASSLAIAFDHNVTAGDLLLAAVGANNLDGSANTATLSDGLGSTWSQVGGYVTSGSPYSIALFMALAGGSGADTVTLTCATTAGFVRLLTAEFSGATALDKHSFGTGFSYPLDSGAMVTTVADELVFGWGVADQGNTSPGAGFTLARTQAVESTEYMIVSTTGTYHATFPGDVTSSDWCCIGATFR